MTQLLFPPLFALEQDADASWWCEYVGANKLAHVLLRSGFFAKGF